MTGVNAWCECGHPDNHHNDFGCLEKLWLLTGVTDCPCTEFRLVQP